MIDRNSFQKISIGFLSGILASGILFLCLKRINYPPMVDQFIISQTFPSSEQDNKNYLVQTAEDEGKININSATDEELMTLPGIGESKANAIIVFREKYGNYADIKELSNCSAHVKSH
jgi:competence ComEA-like helix-hairpin-helix protein